MIEPSIKIVLPTTGEVIQFNGQKLASGQVTRIALEIPQSMSFEEWARLGEALVTAEQSVMWWIGDWWTYGEHRYGERSKILGQLKEAGYNPPRLETCIRAGVISKKFKTDRRRSVLSHAHHVEVASLDPKQADWFLDRAQTSDWTRKELRDEVRRYKLEALRRPGDRKYETQTVDDLFALITADKQFGTIYADPPWPYGNQATRASTKNHYKAHNDLSIEDICALPVNQLSADAAHCHLWTTNGFLREAFDVMEAWGFAYKSCFIWVKPDFGIGNYWRVGHEFMLFGIKGKAPFGDNSQQSWVYEQAGEHSAKPPSVRRILERTSPGPRLELFGRKEVDGWTVWGNEVERKNFDVTTFDFGDER